MKARIPSASLFLARYNVDAYFEPSHFEAFYLEKYK